MELQRLVLDALPDIRFEPIVEVLNRAAATDKDLKLFFERLIDVAAFLKSCKPLAKVNATLLPGRPPKLLILGTNKASVDLWADYYDCTPIEVYTDLHLRLRIKRDGDRFARELRTTELGEAARQIRLALNLRDA